MPCALVKGRGIAGLTLARRLARAGWNVEIVGRPMLPGRIVTLDPSVSMLLHLEFGEDLVRRIAPVAIEERLLKWRPGVPETIFARLLVSDLSRITAAVEAELPPQVSVTQEVIEALPWHDALVDATGRSSMPLVSSGVRTAFSWLLPSTAWPKRAFLGASALGGWTFVVPAHDDRLLIQTVLPGPPGPMQQQCALTVAADVLASTCRSAVLDAILRTSPETVDATPTFSHPVTQDGVLRVGDRTATADPISGDGVGRAIRTAILAAAVLLDTECRREVALNHYVSRIASAHAAHLSATASFYADSICAQSFASDIGSMRRDARSLETFATSLAQPIRVDAQTNAVRLIRTA